MSETRTWEQMRADNEGAVWIDDNGEFCEHYEDDGRPFAGLSKEVQEEQKKLQPWQRLVFNGCWSCANAPYCERYINSFQK